MVKENWPSKEELNKVLKKLEKVEGTLMLPENPTPLEKFRWDICQQFIRYAREHALRQVDLAEELGIDKSQVHKILHHRIDEFTTDRLISYLQQLKPNTKLRVS